MGKALCEQWSSFEAIEAGWSSEPTEAPRRLALDVLATSPRAWASRDMGQYAVERHVAELADTLRRTRRALEPITVAQVDGWWLVVDGHLRVMAYHCVGWKSKVPVKVFRGSAREALQESIAENSKARLPLTAEERTNAAWKMTRVGGFSKRQIMEATAVGHGSTARMRQLLELMRAAGVDPEQFPRWKDARVALRDRRDFNGVEEYDVEAEVELYLKALGQALPPHVMAKRLDVFAMAIARFAGRRAEEFAATLAEEVGASPFSEGG